jgi:serine/threonine protein kinase
MQRPIKFEKFVLKLAEAVDYLHKNNIIHRDLKPANLIYDKKADSIKIVDFGLSKLENGQIDSGDKEGSPPYQDDEGYFAGRVSPDVDWWSVGIILLEYSIGHIPLVDAVRNNTVDSKAQQKFLVEISKDFKAGLGNNLLTDEISQIKDKRIVRLILGLLQPYGTRWNSQQIKRWLKGEDVVVDFRRELLGETVDENIEYDSTYNGSFSTSDSVINSADDLYKLLTTNYPKCNELFTDSNIRERFKAWTKGYSSKDIQNLIIAQIDSNERPEYRGMVVQKVIKPKNELYYRGVELSTNGINRVLKEAQKETVSSNQTKTAIPWLISVNNGSIFGSVEALSGSQNNSSPWMNWQTHIQLILEEADKLIHNCKVPSFGYCYSRNKLNYLYIIFSAVINKESKNDIQKDTSRRYDEVAYDILSGDQFSNVSNFIDEFVKSNEISRLFIANIVLEELIKMTETEAGNQGIDLNSTEIQESLHFKKLKSNYRNVNNGVRVWGMNNKEIKDRVNNGFTFKSSYISLDNQEMKEYIDSIVKHQEYSKQNIIPHSTTLGSRIVRFFKKLFS